MVTVMFFLMMASLVVAMALMGSLLVLLYQEIFRGH